MIHASAPGKLFIAGEYAVVEPGGSAILVAVDRRVRVSAESADRNVVRSAYYDEDAVTWERSGAGIVIDRPWDVVLSAIDVVEALAGSGEPVELTITSDLDDADGAKYGLGSSAAVVVAVIGALSRYRGLTLDSTAVLKLALLATWRVNPLASGGDVAASVLGGWVSYRSADAAAVVARKAEIGVAALLSEEWPGLVATSLPAPADRELLVGWTGSPASTASLVGRSRQSRVAADPEYRAFFAESDAVVASLADALRSADAGAFDDGIRRARQALAAYAALAGIEIETPALTALCDVAAAAGAVAKSSGAGGGDCGVAFAAPSADRESLASGWRAAGIRPLDLAVDIGLTVSTEPQHGTTPSRSTS